MPDEPVDYAVERLRRRLAEDPQAAELGIGVDVVGDEVVLTGEVACEERRDRITAVAREALPGLRVRDGLSVARIDGPTDGERLP